MAGLSSYVQYLPVALWNRKVDPSQLLARALRVPEKILTGIEIDTIVARPTADIVTAMASIVKVQDEGQASRFRVGDAVTIEGTPERQTITHILDNEIRLGGNLTGNYAAVVLRIADLRVGDRTLRVASDTAIGLGSLIAIDQGLAHDDGDVVDVQGGFVTLRVGLGNAYSLSASAASTLVRERVPIVHDREIDVESAVARPVATITNASGITVTVASNEQASRFQPGDVVTIEGTTERQTVILVSNNQVRLAANLTGNYPSGQLRIANLRVGDRTFRISDTAAIGTGSLVVIDQGVTHDEADVLQIQDGFVTLRTGLVNAFPLSLSDGPATVRDRFGSGRSVKVTHEHEDFEHVIDHLHEIFNPWQTRKDLLPWLASWVSLTLKPEPQWTDYQRRELISRIVPIYLQRGLKTGLHTYLDIWAFHPSRPRVAVDDGNAMFHGTLADDGSYTLHASAQSQSVVYYIPPPTIPPTPPDKVTALLHPTGIAFNTANQYFVADEGDLSLVPVVEPALWLVSPTGALRFGAPTGSTEARPTPIYSGTLIENPVAVVVDTTNRCSILCQGYIATANSNASGIYRFGPPPNYAISTVIDSTNVNFTAIAPVDMTLDGTGKFVVLDRGVHPLGSPPSGAAAPYIYVVRETPTLTVTPHALTSADPNVPLVEPTAILAEPGGTFLIADAGDQADTIPAQIFRVTNPNPLLTGWTATPLMSTDPANNQLVFPTGMVFENAQTLIVCDTGVRWGYAAGDPNFRSVAEDAALYRIDLSPGVNCVTSRVTSGRQMVNPTRVAIDRKGTLVVMDRGETLTGANQRSWRAGVSEFGVGVLFSQRNTIQTTLDERNRVRGEVFTVVDKERPAHTSAFMDFV